MAFFVEQPGLSSSGLPVVSVGVWQIKGIALKWMWESAEIGLPKLSRKEKFLLSLWDTTALHPFDDNCWNILPDRMIFGIT